MPPPPTPPDAAIIKPMPTRNVPTVSEWSNGNKSLCSDTDDDEDDDDDAALRRARSCCKKALRIAGDWRISNAMHASKPSPETSNQRAPQRRCISPPVRAPEGRDVIVVVFVEETTVDILLPSTFHAPNSTLHTLLRYYSPCSVLHNPQEDTTTPRAPKIRLLFFFVCKKKKGEKRQREGESVGRTRNVLQEAKAVHFFYKGL